MRREAPIVVWGVPLGDGISCAIWLTSFKKHRTMNFLNHSFHRSHQALRTLWDLCCWFWPCPAAEGVASSSRAWLRGFLLLKLVTVLLFPHWTVLGLILGCPCSIKALLLLSSPHISTKPSTVFLYQLALTDGLLLLHWMLKVGHKLALYFGADLGNVLTQDLHMFWLKEALTVISNHLLNAHLLASLLFLGLLGLEATFVLRWPLQTRSIRTSHCARLGCTLVWILVLVELIFVMFSKIQNTPSASSFFPMDTLSFCIRKVLWLCDLWLHYNIIYYKPRKRKSSFH